MVNEREASKIKSPTLQNRGRGTKILLRYTSGPPARGDWMSDQEETYPTANGARRPTPLPLHVNRFAFQSLKGG